MVHAIALTLMRLLFTQRRLLEWETAAAAAARAAGLSARSDVLLFVGEMAASPLIALVVLVIVAGARPAALPVAAPDPRALARRADHRRVAEPAGPARSTATG